MLLHSPLGKLDTQPGEVGKVNFLTYRGKQEARRPEQALLTLLKTLLKTPHDTEDKRLEPADLYYEGTEKDAHSVFYVVQ